LHPCIIAAPYQGALNPRLAFILGRTALIFQNRFAFTSFFRNFATSWRTYSALGKKKKYVSFVLPSFFRNFAEKSARLPCLGKKRNEFLLFCSRLFVPLQNEKIVVL